MKLNKDSLSFCSVNEIEHFIPGSFYSRKEPKRTLHNFIHDIKEVAQFLLIDMVKVEVTGVIVKGLYPEVRNCLVFLCRPKC